jgi:hypothetical protein
LGAAPVTSNFTGTDPIIDKSGDAAFDLALAQTLTRISQIFSVLPGFAYFDDSAAPNAYASPENRMSKTDGTVLFGTTLLQQVRAVPESPEVAIVCVCAHEFGHIHQFKKGLRQRLLKGQSTVKRLELHADFVAGVFAGIRKKEKPGFPAAVFAATMHRFGDTSFSSPTHHGTADERANALVEGYNAIKIQNMTFDEAIQAGTEYVEKI